MTAGTGERTADASVIDDWWREVLATGLLPAAATPVIVRLVRQVGRAELPSGPVYLKVMAFPRARDRLRYLFRPLPAAHEAQQLQRVAGAGIPCPELVAARTARRAGLPHRSLLVLRALPAGGAASGDPLDRLRRCVRLARLLLDAGLWHSDLNRANFASLPDGRLAVLDLQSIRVVRPGTRRAAVHMASRLLLDAVEVAPATVLAELESGGLARRGEAAAIRRRAARVARGFLRERVRRCLKNSTEFEHRWCLRQREHIRRGAWPPGRWLPVARSGAAGARAAWLGQRHREVFEQGPALLQGLRRRWLWSPGPDSVYIPDVVAEDRAPDVLRTAAADYARYQWLWKDAREPAADLEVLRAACARHVRDARRVADEAR